MNFIKLERIKSVVQDLQQKAMETGCRETIKDHNNLIFVFRFIEQVYEIAFGDNAINREFTIDEILDRLREFSDDAHAHEQQQITARPPLASIESSLLINELRSRGIALSVFYPEELRDMGKTSVEVENIMVEAVNND